MIALPASVGILKPMAISTNLALGLHFEDADGSLTFSEETGKIASVSRSARIYNPANGYTLKAHFPFSNTTQLTDQTGRHTVGSFNGSNPASGQDYLFFNSASSQMGEIAIGDAYQGDFDRNEDVKMTFDVAVCNSPTTGTFFYLNNNAGNVGSFVNIGYAVSSGTWKLRISFGGSAVTGTVGHTCETSTSPPYTNFYSLTLTVSGNVATLSSALDSVSATLPTNIWIHHITNKGPTIGATQNTTTPSYSTYGRFALKNFKYYLRDQYPSSIPSNGSFGKWALFTGGDLLKFDGHADFTFNSASNWTICFRFLIPSGPTDGSATIIPFYIGDIASSTNANRAYIKITPSASGISVNFFGTNASSGSGGFLSTTPRDTWHTAMVARNGSANQTRVYIDGTLVGGIATNYIDLATPPVYLGGGRDAAGTLVTYKGFCFLDDLYIRKSCEQTGSSYSVPTTPFTL